MEKLRQIMQENSVSLERMAQMLAAETLLSEDLILSAHTTLNQLQEEQKRCTDEVTAVVGCSAEECSSIARMKELLEEHALLKQQKLREEEVLRLALRFAAIVGEEDYGFALEVPQKKLKSKTAAELLEMDETGKLAPYRMVLEYIEKGSPTIDQVLPLKNSFEPNVMIGLMANKYVCMLADPPAEEIPEAAQPAAEAADPELESPVQTLQDDVIPEVAQDTLPPENPIEEVCTETSEPEDHQENDVQDAPAGETIVAEFDTESADETSAEEETQEENMPIQLPTVELPELVTEGTGKLPRESDFVNLVRKSTKEMSTVATRVAYGILSEWGCRKSFIHAMLDQFHAPTVIDRAIARLQKDGFITSYSLENEPDDDYFMNVTPSGYQILSKDSLMRKIGTTPSKYLFHELSNSGMFVRMRRMNEVEGVCVQMGTAATVRAFLNGFAGMWIISYPDQSRKMLYLPLLCTNLDTEADFKAFLSYITTDYPLDADTCVVVETPEDHQAFWKDYLRRNLSGESVYYISPWGADAFADDNGNVQTLESLLNTYFPKPEAASEEKPESGDNSDENTVPTHDNDNNEHVSPDPKDNGGETVPSETGEDSGGTVLAETEENSGKTDLPETEDDSSETVLAETEDDGGKTDLTETKDDSSETVDPVSWDDDGDIPLPASWDDYEEAITPETVDDNDGNIIPEHLNNEDNGFVEDDWNDPADAIRTESAGDIESDVFTLLGENATIEETARVLAKTNITDKTQLLRDLITKLVNKERYTEALVLAKTLTSVCNDKYFDKCYKDLLHATNLPLEDRDYSRYLIEPADHDDVFGWYCRISAAFWAACFPKVAYDHTLYSNIDGMVVSRLDRELPPELISVKHAMTCLTDDLKNLSFKKGVGDGAGLSAFVLGMLTSNAIQQQKRIKLMHAAKEKVNAPRSNISITGLETLMKNMMSPAGEFGPCMKIIAEDNTAAYQQVQKVFSQFVKDSEGVSERLMNMYIDNQWDELRRVEKNITLRRLDNESPARKTLRRELGKRLEIMEEWLQRNAGISGAGGFDHVSYQKVVGRISKYMSEADYAISTALRATSDRAVTAGMKLLRSTLKRIMSIINGNEELVQDSAFVFAELLTTKYPLLDSNGDPILDESLNEMPGMEPWRLMLQHIASEHKPLPVVLEQIENSKLNSKRFEDYGSGMLIRSVLGKEPGEYMRSDGTAREGCRKDEDGFRGNVRLACAYGQIAEETKETLFAQLSRYRPVFIPEQDAAAAAAASEEVVYGNFAHFRMLLNCLKTQMEEAKSMRHADFLRMYSDRAAQYSADRIPPMLRQVQHEISHNNYATAEEYLSQFDAGIVDLPQRTNQKEEINFHDRFIDCADWYCRQCELPAHKNRGPRDWGRRVLQSLHFWSAGNESKSAESMLENWPYMKGSNNNPRMIRQFLNLIGMTTVTQVFSSPNHPETSQYEVFLANIQPMESGKEDYSHPIAKFGTQQSNQMYIVCLYGCKGSATLIDIMTKRLQLGGNTLVLMDGVVNMLERRRVAAQFKTMTSGQNSFLLIDRVLMLYLAAQDSGNRLNAMLQCTLPYTYEQLYIQGAGRVADEMFMGRIAERKSLCEMNGTCLVYGGRQLGKTALLRRVESINHKPHDKRYAGYLEIKKKGSEAFIKKLKDLLLELPTENPLLDGTEVDLEEICDSLRRNRALFNQLTILVDEVDVYFEEIAPGNYDDLHPVVLLQEELQGKVKFVFAGTHNVASTSKAIQNNADIIKLREPLCIKPLSSGEAIQLIRRPLSYLGFEIGEQQIALILANTNSYPGLIHLFCHALVESICNNYSEYYSAGSKNPPYTISDEQLHTIFREKDIKREIAQRVMATIEVDEKYSIVSKLLAFMEYQDQEQGITRLYGYTPGEIQEVNEREFGIPEFMPDALSIKDLNSLMEEMAKMGILWKNPEQGSYRFRQKDFLGYIGSSRDVEIALLGGIS